MDRRFRTIGFLGARPRRLAYAAAQVTNSLLCGVTPSSPHVFALTAGTLSIVVLIATLLPARRASRANPIFALND